MNTDTFKRNVLLVDFLVNLWNVYFTMYRLPQDDWITSLSGNTLYTELLPLVEQTSLPFLQQVQHLTGVHLDDR